MYANGFDKRRLEIVNGQSANMAMNIVLAKASAGEEFPSLAKCLEAYEETFEKVAMLNRRLLVGDRDE